MYLKFTANDLKGAQVIGIINFKCKSSYLSHAIYVHIKLKKYAQESVDLNLNEIHKDMCKL